MSIRRRAKDRIRVAEVVKTFGDLMPRIAESLDDFRYVNLARSSNDRRGRRGNRGLLCHCNWGSVSS